MSLQSTPHPYSRSTCHHAFIWNSLPAIRVLLRLSSAKSFTLWHQHSTLLKFSPRDLDGSSLELLSFYLHTPYLDYTINTLICPVMCSICMWYSKSCLLLIHVSCLVLVTLLNFSRFCLVVVVVVVVHAFNSNTWDQAETGSLSSEPVSAIE